jgi:hypothetical protein
VAYYVDLTSYRYWDGDPYGEEPWPGLALVNIGWLDADHPFPSGIGPPGLLARLERLAKVRVRQTRGYHYCEMCVRDLGRPDLAPTVAHESAEFRVRGTARSTPYPSSSCTTSRPTSTCHHQSSAMPS